MTSGAFDERGAGSPAELPASLRQLFAVATSATMLLWLPLSVIPILDGLLFVAPLQEVLRDLGLLWLIGLLPAAVLAFLGMGVVRLTRAAGASVKGSALAGWCVVLLPLAWVCAWQAARMAWQWLRVVASVDLTITQNVRAVAVLLLAAGLALAVWRLPLEAAVRWVVATLYSARRAAAALLVLALVAVVLQPPAVLLPPMNLHRSELPLNSAPRAAGAPEVIVVSLDALAAADADACNPSSATMPRLAAFAARASCFTRFYAASNFTTPTTSTMESGLLPWTHFANQPDAKMSDATRPNTLAAALKAKGWRTHSITDNLLASPLHRGTFAAYTSAGLAHTTLYGNWFREAMTVFPDTALPRLAAAALSFLGAFDIALHGDRSPYDSDRTYAELLSLLAQDSRDAPLFVWAHTLPPHSPYLPPPSTKYHLLPRGQLETWSELMPDNVDYAPADQPRVDMHRLRYRESIMAADASLGAFLDELDHLGRLDAALVVITADHGESFEKGFLGHAAGLTHDTLIRVPLVVKLPGQKVGQVLRMPVSQADLAPTLLDVIGAPPLPRTEGRSLRAALEGRPLPPEPVFAMTMERQSRFRPLTHGRFVVIDGDEKLTLTLDPTSTALRPTSTLFDLVSDPGESRDLAPQRPDRARQLQALLRQRLARAEQARAAAVQP
jgi:arylsulfatase A-like enzyme